MFCLSPRFLLFFFNDTATTEIYTLSLHDALPICSLAGDGAAAGRRAGRKMGARRGDSSHAQVPGRGGRGARPGAARRAHRSEEHTSELQSLAYLVCRLLLEKKKQKQYRVRRCTER